MKRTFSLGPWEVTISFRRIARDKIKTPLADDMINLVTGASGVPLKTIRSRNKATEVYHARVLLCWALKNACQLTPNQIARVINKDRTAVAYELQSVPILIQSSQPFRKLWSAVEPAVVGCLLPGLPQGNPGPGGPGGGPAPGGLLSQERNVRNLPPPAGTELGTVPPKLEDSPGS